MFYSLGQSLGKAGPVELVSVLHASWCSGGGQHLGSLISSQKADSCISMCLSIFLVSICPILPNTPIAMVIEQ